MYPNLISIEGNICAGKSSIIKELRKDQSINIIDEPLEEWLNLKTDDGKNILQAFYED